MKGSAQVIARQADSKEAGLGSRAVVVAEVDIDGKVAAPFQNSNPISPHFWSSHAARAMLLGLLVLAGGCAGSKGEDALERANGPVLHLSSQYVPHTLLYGVKAAACCGAIVIVLRVRALCVRCACVCIDPFLGHYPGPPARNAACPAD